MQASLTVQQSTQVPEVLAGAPAYLQLLAAEQARECCERMQDRDAPLARRLDLIQVSRVHALQNRASAAQRSL